MKLRRQKVEPRPVCTMRWPSSLAQLAVAQCPVASFGIACRSRIGRTLNQVKGDKVNKGRVWPQTRRYGAELDGGWEMPPRVRRSVRPQEPQQRDADDSPGEADPDGDQERSELIGQALVGACRHGRVHHRPQDAANRVDQRPFPGEHPPQPFRRPDEAQQRRDYRRPVTPPGWRPSSAPHRWTFLAAAPPRRPGDWDSPGDQPDHHAAGGPRSLPSSSPSPAS